MMNIWYLFYNIIVLPILFSLISVLALFSKKIKDGISDRKKLFENLIINVQDLDRSKKTIWFHQSSMGEFEQAKPIIEEMYKRGRHNIVITFFSPSGYRNSKNYPYAHLISYLPFDTPNNAKKFLAHVRPSLAIFMRYDIWPNYIWLLNSKKIKTFLVDATMRKNSKRKLPFAHSFHKHLFSNFTSILTVSKEDKYNFDDFHLKSVKTKAVGDTRFDRVFNKSNEAKTRKLIDDKFFENKKVIVAGSSWEADEDVILPAFLKLTKYDDNVVLILVPHEPTLIHLDKIENYLAGKEKSIRFSYLSNNYNNEKIIIVDSIGILLTLYYYADIAYIGGSFKQGIHNVLEPAVYDIPVVFGPKHGTSREARELARLGCGKVIKNKKEAYRVFRQLTSNDTLRQELGLQAGSYVKQNLGATNEIIAEIEKYVKL